MIPAGIDIGCQTSTVAVFDGDRAQAVPDRRGATQRPSIAALTDAGSALVGPQAEELLESQRFGADPRQLGPRLLREVPGQLGTAWTAGSGAATHTAVDITSALLGQLIETTQEVLHDVLSPQVYAIPAAAGAAYRHDLQAAAARSFSQVDRFVSSTAAMAVSHATRQAEPGLWLVIDAGASALGASLIEYSDDCMEVVSVHGSSTAGGGAWREGLSRNLRHQLWSARQVDLFGDPWAESRLDELAQESLIALAGSQSQSHQVDLTGIDPRCADLTAVVDRGVLETVATAPIERAAAVLEVVLSAAEDDPDLVLLTGGLSRLPPFRQLVSRVVPGTKIRAVPADSAALGAAVQAALKCGASDRLLLLDSTSHSIGVVVNGGAVAPVLFKNTNFPTRRSIELIARAEDPLVIHVVEGDADWAHDTTTVALLKIPVITTAASSPRRALLTVDIDANCKLGVKVTTLEDAVTTQLAVEPRPFQPTQPLDRYPYACVP